MLSLLGSSFVSFDVRLGSAFARVCAAEARTLSDGRHPPRLDPSDDVAHADEIVAVVSPSIGKGIAPPRDTLDGAHLAWLAAPSSSSAALPLEARDTATPWWPSEPPTRARARLMVFLN